MGASRLSRTIVALFAACCVVTGCSAAPSGSPTLPSVHSTSHPSPAESWSLVALGDSVPRGMNCDCTTYPALIADGLASTTREPVTAINDAVDGYTTSNVLEQLASDPDVIAHVRVADVVTIEVGANDVPYSESCGSQAGCYTSEMPALRENLNAIVARVHELTAGRKVLVVLLDYWSVWLGGQYAAARGEAYVDAATTVTDEVNSVIKSIATGTDSTYVDLRAAFKGPDYADDDTQFLSDDGDHPSAAGHQQIADAAQDAMAAALHG
jgi:acyl-CoA thioesterase-1